MLRRRSLGSDCCGWSGLSRFCAHTNSNASARVDRGADGDTCFDPDGLALSNCCSNANSAAPSDSCSHIGARAHPGRRAYKLDPVRLFRARVRLNMERLSNEWESIERGVEGAISFLDEEHIFDRHRLPTVAVVPVLASVWSQMPQSLDAHGEARTLLRQYLWRSFFTERYERAAATAALQDHRGLKARLVEGATATSIPILDEARFPIAEVGELERAPWPRLRNTLSRGILAVSLRGSGTDFADGTPASRESLSKREYHHLFPAALLKNEGDMDEADINLALNCALVTWNTNRNISAKEPVAYLRERVERAPLGEDQIRSRLSSHIIPFEGLNVGGYSGIADEKERYARIRSDYECFIHARAEAIHRVVKKLCSGEEWNSLEGC